MMFDLKFTQANSGSNTTERTYYYRAGLTAIIDKRCHLYAVIKKAQFDSDSLR